MMSQRRKTGKAQRVGKGSAVCGCERVRTCAGECEYANAPSRVSAWVVMNVWVCHTPGASNCASVHELVCEYVSVNMCKHECKYLCECVYMSSVCEMHVCLWASVWVCHIYKCIWGYICVHLCFFWKQWIYLKDVSRQWLVLSPSQEGAYTCPISQLWDWARVSPRS